MNKVGIHLVDEVGNKWDSDFVAVPRVGELLVQPLRSEKHPEARHYRVEDVAYRLDDKQLEYQIRILVRKVDEEIASKKWDGSMAVY
jgi:hypothetical protein